MPSLLSLLTKLPPILIVLIFLFFYMLLNLLRNSSFLAMFLIPLVPHKYRSVAFMGLLSWMFLR